MDKYRIDSHKLMYHPERISDWLQGKLIYPVYMEVSPAGSCNHRCVYCGLDFMGYRPKFLDSALFKKRLVEMGRLGVKSIMYAGEGEPFLHKDMPEITRATKESGIDAAFTTNAVLLSPDLAKKVLPYASWIKVSINAGTAATYEKIHRCPKGDFERVFRNMEAAAKLRKSNGYACALGMQLVLLTQNHKEVQTLARKARDIGMDYLVVKPYSQHPQSKTRIFSGIKYDKHYDMEQKLKKYNGKDFNVVFRVHTMRKWDRGERNYKHCLALPFWAYIDSEGNLWACSMYLNKDKFKLGNILDKGFKDVWESGRRKALVRWAGYKLNTAKCRVNCRMDEVNRYLWELTHPSEHVNFI